MHVSSVNAETTPVIDADFSAYKAELCKGSVWLVSLQSLVCVVQADLSGDRLRSPVHLTTQPDYPDLLGA